MLLHKGFFSRNIIEHTYPKEKGKSSQIHPSFSRMIFLRPGIRAAEKHSRPSVCRTGMPLHHAVRFSLRGAVLKAIRRINI